MVHEHFIAHRISIQKSLKAGSNKHSPLSIGHDSVGQREDVLESLLAASGDEQDQVAARVVGGELGLVLIVGAELAFDGLHIVPRADAFGAVIEFEHVVERAAIGGDELEAAIGEHGAAVDGEPNAVFAGEVSQRDPVSMTANGDVNDHLSQGVGMVVMAMADFFEVTPRWE